MFEVTDLQKIGLGLAGFGITFLFLGVLMIFDRGLLAIGNILFISGLTCIIGFKRTYNFFFQKHKIKATVAFFLGISIVLLGYPLIGMIVETYGFILLFGGFLPATIEFLRRVPVIGNFLNLPVISSLVSRIEDKRTRDNYA
ncbi:vesicle transport protein GOT1B [Chironomus tepperi]|uniref:vesicle transport protein GOT1B n=1 Tax=Chironomus tepperi TaxID=113505 RepID=UPI00391F0632